jgi:hypothetical protein
MLPPQTNDFQKPVKFKSDMSNVFFGKKGEKPSEEKAQPQENPKPKPSPIPFHCDHCGRDGHLAEYCFRRKRDERFAREMTNKDRYALLVVCMSLVWCLEVRVLCTPFCVRVDVSLCLVV